MTRTGPAAPALLHYYRGRVALYAILRALGVRAGDEVIDPRTCTMDLSLLPAALTGRTRAVIVQHTFGVPVDMKRALAVTEPAGVPVVEDCAHVTSGPARESLGTAGVAAFFSYEWGKPVVAGVGGLAVVNDAGLAATMREQYASFTAPPPRREIVMSAQYLAHRAATRAGLLWRLRTLYRSLAGLGLIVGSYEDDPGTSPEYGWRMSRTVRRRLPGRIRGAQAALGRRRRLAARYRAALTGLGPALPETPEGPVPLRIPLEVGAKARVLREAAAAGVELGDWFTSPVHPFAGDDLAAASYRPGSCPHAEWAAEHVVTLPVRADTRLADADRALRLLARLQARGDA
jgi:dTDP-4-amino-4,6-dideoxygalactose transaminase